MNTYKKALKQIEEEIEKCDPLSKFEKTDYKIDTQIQTTFDYTFENSEEYEYMGEDFGTVEMDQRALQQDAPISNDEYESLYFVANESAEWEINKYLNGEQSADEVTFDLPDNGETNLEDLDKILESAIEKSPRFGENVVLYGAVKLSPNGKEGDSGELNGYQRVSYQQVVGDTNASFEEDNYNVTFYVREGVKGVPLGEVSNYEEHGALLSKNQKYRIISQDDDAKTAEILLLKK